MFGALLFAITMDCSYPISFQCHRNGVIYFLKMPPEFCQRCPVEEIAKRTMQPSLVKPGCWDSYYVEHDCFDKAPIKKPVELKIEVTK